MGRKSSAAASKTNVDKVLTPENAYPYQERVEQQPSSGNLQSPKALDSQVENPQPRCSPLKHLKLLVDGMETGHERTTPQEQMDQKHEHQKKLKKPKYRSGSVRRSERIKSAAVHPPCSNVGIEYIEDITVSESEKDEPNTQIEQVLVEPEPEPEMEPQPAENSSEKSLDEKVDYALQRIEALDKIIELLKSKVDENIGSYEAQPMASKSYKSMYIDSQKKLEALTDENRQLNGKLQIALGKIEVYEKQNRVLSELWDKTKDTANAVAFSNMAKTTEAAVNASTQALHNACATSASKRKRNEKLKEKANAA